MKGAQLDLFDTLPVAGKADDAELPGMPPEFVDKIRRELSGTLALARDAERLPWGNLTSATLAELRFNSVSRYLPTPEAEAMRADFERELVRLYDVEDRLFEQASAAEAS